MSGVHEQLSAQFQEWEERGRGWSLWPHPVSPEPPFRPFSGHHLSPTPVVDDGRRPTFLSSLVEKLSRGLSTTPPEAPAVPEREEEPEPEPLSRDPLIELQTSLPAKLDISKETFEQFLLNLSLCREPIAFELLGVRNRVTAQFVAHPDDAPSVRRQLQAYFPEAVFQEREGTLENSWCASQAQEEFAVEFGLEREFMFPLTVGKIDPFIGIIGALSELREDEVGLFQVIFQPTQNPWPVSITNSVTGADGKPFFVNAPELVDAAETKVARPLYAVVVRIAIRAGERKRMLQLARDLAGSLRVFAHPQGNALIPLHNEEYSSFEDHIEDVLRRQTRRSGMLLNSDELIGFVHLPGSAVRSAVLERDSGKTKAAPESVRLSTGLLLGENVHAGNSVSVRLSPDQRVRHTHIIGASGTGKSTLLFNLIQQDVENGDGVAVLDPHGDLIDRILGIIPESRVDDVVLVDPSDADFPIGFNILAAHSEQEKTLLASDLVSVFRRLSSSWGDQMDTVLQNSILAFLESSQGGTLADLRRFLIEPAFRAEFLTTVQDPELIYYWQRVFPQLTGNRSVGPVLTRLQGFLSQKPIRNMVSQPENKLDFARIMDEGKIFLARLPEGLLGSENSYMLGTLLVSKFQQIAMSRQAQAVSARRDYWLYIDEFDCFITPTMAEILKGARKYRLGLTLAHQELHQLQSDPKVASAVATHPCTRIVFRVGDDDAKKLAGMFTSFDAQSLKTLETFHGITRVERSDCDFNIEIRPSENLDSTGAEIRRNEVITASRKKYASERSEIEAAILANLHMETTEAERPKAKPVLSQTPKQSEVKPVSSMPEVPNADVAKIAVMPVAQAVEPTRAPPPPRDLGRGGAQHQAIQQRLKTVAEGLGFRAIIEKQVLDGTGSIDLLLERTDRTIGCEISITTSVDWEVGNVAKCAKAGIDEIAVISTSDDRLRKIETAIANSLGPDVGKRVGYFLPDAFIERLESFTPPKPQEPSRPGVVERRGYKVKRTAAVVSAADQKAREDETIRVIADAMRGPKGKE